METIKINVQKTETKKIQKILLGTVAPRPIALASTIDKNGNPNLSPFSFFNVFSAKPPIAIFSPARRIRNNTIKHTLENIQETKEVVINIVTKEIIEQVSLSSSEYKKGINEFQKSGLNQINSELVKPFRVKESPVNFECKVKDIISLGESHGAGNLIICEIKIIHIDKKILNENGDIDRKKINLVGRLDGNWYSETNYNSLFEVIKPNKNLGIGVDKIPNNIKKSSILNGNDLGKLGNIEIIPNKKDISIFKNNNNEILKILNNTTDDKKKKEELHRFAKKLLENNKINAAWKTLLIDK